MKQMKNFLLFSVIMFFVVGVSVTANATPFQNGSFEDGPAVSDGTWNTNGAGSTAITGWTVGSSMNFTSGGTIDYVNGFWLAKDGSMSIDLDGYSAGAIQQEFDTTTSKWYEVSFWMAGNPVIPGQDSDYLDGYDPEKQMFVSAGGFSQEYSFNILSEGATLTDMQWLEQSFIFQAAGNLTTLKFASLMRPDSVYGVALDNISVSETTAPVPEPATMLLLGSGLAGLAGLKRKKFFKTR